METAYASLPRQPEVLDVREELARAGSNTSQRHRLTFYFLLPDQAHADKAAALLRQPGVTVAVEPMTMPWWVRIMRGRMYWCRVEADVIPDAPELDALVNRLLVAAGKAKGQYDGWTGSRLDDTAVPLVSVGVSA